MTGELIVGLLALLAGVAIALVVRHFRSPLGRVRRMETLGSLGGLHVRLVTDVAGSRCVAIELAHGPPRLRLRPEEALRFAGLLRLAAAPGGVAAAGAARGRTP